MDPQSQMDDPPRRNRRRSANPVAIGAVVVAVAVGIAASVWTGLYLLQGRQGDPRLLGTWQSDADATIAEVKKAKPVTDKAEQAMRKLVGKLKVTYTGSTVTTDLDGKVETQPYQVVTKEGNFLVVKYFSSQTNKEELARIEFFDQDTYWVDVARAQLRECFRRVR